MTTDAGGQLPTYFITSRVQATAAISKLLAYIDEIIGFDVEGTGLDPYEPDMRVRTSQFCSPSIIEQFGGPVVFDHFHCGYDFKALMEELKPAGFAFYVFNAGYEGRCLDAHGFSVGPTGDFYLLDTALMRKARMGGGHNLSFAQAVQKDLGVELSKEQQMSDWAAPQLSIEQVTYAGLDAAWVWTFGNHWQDELRRTDTYKGFTILNDAVPGSCAMEDYGMTLDPVHHKKLIRMWELRRAVAEKAILKFTPDLANIRSKQQVGKIISAALDAASIAAWPKTGKTKQLDLSRKVLTQASYRAPYPFSRWLAALMVFNRADKYLGTYGEKLLNIQERAGCIRARFNIAAAITGRYSSSEPNLQNIPRSKLVRRSFVAPKGATLCIADYSGIELRVLAEMTDDEQLRQDVIFGNVHAENAVLITKAHRDTFFRLLAEHDPRAGEARSKAKAFSFQLTYGASPPALAVVLRCSDEEAGEHVSRWAARYPKAYNYRFETLNAMRENGGFIRTVGGRTIYLPKWDQTIPKAANYGIQGSAADVMYRAVTRMHDWCEEYGEGRVFVLASIHDELITIFAEDAELQKEVITAQQTCMEEAWLDIFPGTSTHKLLEIGAGSSWAAK